MKKLLLILLLCSPLFAANSFVGDPNLGGYYSAEADKFSGANFLADIGSTLANPSSVTSDTTNFKVGAGSALWNNSTDALQLSDASASSANWPWQNGNAIRAGTILAWVRTTDLTSTNVLFTKGRPSTNNLTMSMYANSSGDFTIAIGTGTGSTQETWEIAGASIVVNQWYHVAWSFDDVSKAGHIRIWDDSGSSVSNHTNTFSNNINVEAAVNEFGHYPGNVLSWIGQIDDFQIYDYELSNDTIDEIRSGTYNYDAGGNGAVLNHGFSF